MSNDQKQANTPEARKRIERKLFDIAVSEQKRTGATQVQTYSTMQQIIMNLFTNIHPIASAEMQMALAAIMINTNTGDNESVLAAERMLNRHVAEINNAFLLAMIPVKGQV